MMISSFYQAGKHYHPFIPEEQLPADYSLLTIAYNIGQQHYSATKQLINGMWNLLYTNKVTNDFLLKYLSVL